MTNERITGEWYDNFKNKLFGRQFDTRDEMLQWFEANLPDGWTVSKWHIYYLDGLAKVTVSDENIGTAIFLVKFSIPT